MVVWKGSGGGTLKLTPVFRVVSVTLYLEEVEKGRNTQPGWVGWVVMVASKPLCLANDDPEYVALSGVWWVALVALSGGRRPELSPALFRHPAKTGHLYRLRATMESCPKSSAGLTVQQRSKGCGGWRAAEEQGGAVGGTSGTVRRAAA